MSKQRHRRRSQGGTSPETTPQTGSGVAHFSVSEVVQFSMSVDKSDYRYSVGIVYNNFPWPLQPTDKQQRAVEAAAQAVLNARASFPDSSLAQLYDPLTMPPGLTKAHQVLDQQVDKTYGNFKFESEGARMSFLFQLYQKYQA